MKKELLPAIKLTTVLLVLLVIIYPILVWGMAQFTFGSGKGHTINSNGKKYYSNIGQNFSRGEYFWSRPSAVAYNAAGSGGSNKAPTNKEYLQQVRARIDSFLVHNPGVEKSEIPVDLVTASGSGLDPNISVQAAKIQIKRIAKIRDLPETQLEQLVRSNTEDPLFGLLGPAKVNVLKLNIALDEMN